MWKGGLKLLLWKNWKIQSRNKARCLFEIIAPALFIIVFEWFRHISEREKVPEPTIYEPFSVSRMPVPPVMRTLCREIYYVPKSPVTQKIVDTLQSDFFQRYDLNYTFTGFLGEKAMLRSYRNSVKGYRGISNESTSPVLAAIVFENMTRCSEFKLPANIRYTLRFPSTQRTPYDGLVNRGGQPPNWFSTIADYPSHRYPGPRANYSLYGGFPGYYDEGFLYLQSALDVTLSKMVLNSSQRVEYDEFSLSLKRFPYSKYTADNYYLFQDTVMPFLMSMSTVYSVMTITKQIIHDKAIGLTEFTKIMGLTNGLHWLALFIQSSIMLFLSAAFIVFLFKTNIVAEAPILSYSDPSVVFAVLICYFFSLTGFCFLMSTQFSVRKFGRGIVLTYLIFAGIEYFCTFWSTFRRFYRYQTETGATAAGFMWLIVYFPYCRFIRNASESGMLWTKIGWSAMLPGVGLGLIIHSISGEEVLGRGLKWSSFWEGPMSTDQYSMGIASLLLLGNGSIFILLAMYAQLVSPGKSGVALPWYFPFTTWFWTTGVAEKSSGVSLNLGSGQVNGHAHVEEGPKDARAGVDILHLVKSFSTKTGPKLAVNDLTLKMYENQVISLLGHNGAGKTTTMYILTGFFRPTSGQVMVNFCDIQSDLAGARKSLGLCPQHNVLFDDLSVEEHLRFYCFLKGQDRPDEINQEIERMLQVLDLVDKRCAPARTLSGGMKRKLSVGIAFAAGSKVVLLDEPTAGMDVEARRSTWDLIQSEKVCRTVLLSTHYMEEADLLGDRIAVMAEGQLQCCGSSLFLKSKYDGSYNLVMLKQPSGCNVEKINKEITKIIPTAICSKDVDSEIHYHLPASSTHKFCRVFEKLENRQEDLALQSFAVESYTMEQLYMRVGEVFKTHLEEQQGTNGPKNFGGPSNQGSSTSQTQVQPGHNKLLRNDGAQLQRQLPKNSGMRLLLQQLNAMLKKNLLVTKRSWNMILIQLMAPIAIALCVLHFTLEFTGAAKKEGPLTYDMAKMKVFKDTIVLFDCPKTISDYESTVCENARKLCKGSNLDTESIPGGKSITSAILTKEESHMSKFEGKYEIAFEERLEEVWRTLPQGTLNGSVKKRVINSLFNNQPYHTPPVALNLLTNSLLHYFNTNHSISVTGYPLESTPLDRSYFPKLSFSKWFFAGWSTSIGTAFISSSFVIFTIREKETKSRHLQFIAGVNCFIFWVSNWFVNMLLMLVYDLLLLTILMFTYIEELKGHLFGKVTVLMMAYAWAMTFLCMFLSTVCSNAPAIYSRLVALQGAVGPVFMLLVASLSSPSLKMEQHVGTMEDILNNFPNFALGTGMANLEAHDVLHQHCSTLNLKEICQGEEKSSCCTEYHESFYAWRSLGIGQHIVRLLSVGFLFLLLLIIQELGLTKMAKKKLGNLFCVTELFSKFSSIFESNSATQTLNLDRNGRNFSLIPINCDVAQENQRIQETDVAILHQTDSLVLRNLTKVYEGSCFAVDKLNLGVKRGEIFGLLGTNGAGKTSTFKMLTGELSITSGDAFINCRSVKKSRKEAHSHIGYCPQVDACMSELSGRETLTMFAMLKGIPEEEIPKVVEDVAQRLLFSEFLDRQFATYSGGNKRKLSTALAMIGNPSIIFLDEPTAGLDPEARRHAWNALIDAAKFAGTSIVITSHLMEECEILCSKLGIMVRGRLRCLGSPQHLKSQLCQGYSLVAHLPFTPHIRNENVANDENLSCDWESTLSRFAAFLKAEFPGGEIKDVRPGFVQCQIPTGGTKWSKIFSSMEEAKVVFKLKAYSLGQVNLENVFFECIKS